MRRSESFSGRWWMCWKSLLYSSEFPQFRASPTVPFALLSFPTHFLIVWMLRSMDVFDLPIVLYHSTFIVACWVRSVSLTVIWFCVHCGESGGYQKCLCTAIRTCFWSSVSTTSVHGRLWRRLSGQLTCRWFQPAKGEADKRPQYCFYKLTNSNQQGS